MLEGISLDKTTDKNKEGLQDDQERLKKIIDSHGRENYEIEIRVDIHIAHLVSAIMLLTLKQISPL